MIERVFNYPPKPVENIGNQQKNQNSNQVKIDQQRVNFNEILKSKLQNSNQLTFSAHASNRLQERDISLSSEDKQQLSEAVDKLSEKGSKESLIRLNNLSFVVNIPNKTVITAMDDNSPGENIFTNIDSAMIMNNF